MTKRADLQRRFGDIEEMDEEDSSYMASGILTKKPIYRDSSPSSVDSMSVRL
jgi:hypothetical protein